MANTVGACTRVARIAERLLFEVKSRGARRTNRPPITPSPYHPITLGCQHVAGLSLVDLHLGDEVIEGVEAGVRADALQEIGGQRLTIEVAVEIEQVSLDHARAVVDGGPVANVGDGGPGRFVTR